MSLLCSALILRRNHHQFPQVFLLEKSSTQFSRCRLNLIYKRDAIRFYHSVSRPNLELWSQKQVNLVPSATSVTITGFREPYRPSPLQTIRLFATRSCAKTRDSGARQLRESSPSLDRFARRRAGRRKLPVRTKYLSLASWSNIRSIGSDGDTSEKRRLPRLHYDKEWLDRYHKAAGNGRPARVGRRPSPRTNSLLRQYAGAYVTRAKTRLAWLKLRPSARLPLWRSLMLWSLQHSPKRALALLLASLEGNYVPVAHHVLTQCLEHLANHFLLEPEDLDPRAFHAIHRSVCLFLDRSDGSQLVPYVPSFICWLLVRLCNEQQFVALMAKFRKRRLELHANTHLQALERSLELGDVSLALQSLRAVSLSGMDTSRTQVQMACAKLVRLAFDSPNRFALRAQVMSDIFELGIQPNLIVCKAMLMSAFEDKKYGFGLKIFKTMEERGLKVDSLTYRLLIIGARRIPDHAKVRTLTRKVEHDEPLLTDLDLTTTIFRAISRPDGQDWGPSLRFYGRHWDLEPLKELGIADMNLEAPFSRQEAVRGRLPDPVTVRQLLCIFLRANKLSGNLSTLYTRYQALIKQGHPLIGRLGSTDHVANAYLMCFGLRPETLNICATVVRDMLDASQSERLSVKSEQTGPVAAPPTVRTWSILAASYFKQGQKQAAEKVLGLMRERGIKHEQATWDMIIEGYTSLQDIGKTVDAVVGMQAAGLDVTKRTRKSLRNIMDREELLGAFRDSFPANSNPENSSLHALRDWDASATVEGKIPKEGSEPASPARMQKEYTKFRVGSPHVGIA